MDTSDTQTPPLKTLVIIPAYNEQDSIVAVAERIAEAGYDYLIINDGSTDKTLELCLSHGLNVVSLPQNLGIGGSVQTGHKYALEHGYDVDVQFDGDGQHDVESISVLLKSIKDGANLAIGSRFIHDNQTFRSTRLRRVGIIWLSQWIKLFTGKKATDPTSGFRACDRRAIRLFCESYPTDYPEPESIVYAIHCGLSVQDIPATMHERQGGESSIGKLSSIYYMIKVSLAIAIVGLSKKHRVMDDAEC